jgi:hypothetical protein
MVDAVPNILYSEHLYGADQRFKRNSGREDERITYLMWARQLTNLAISRFKWEGMPDTVDLRFLELTLFHHALSVFYKNNDLDVFLAVQGSGTGYMNYIQNPVSFNIITAGGDFAGDPTQQFQSPNFISAYNPAVDYDKVGEDPKQCGIPIWANALRTPDKDVVTIYARRFAMIDRTIEINTMSARRPKVLKANKETQLTLTNIKSQIDGGADFIALNAENGSMPLDDIAVLDFSIDAKQLNELSLLKARWWNECMGLFGIDNSNQDKKERLVASEVDANNGQTDSFRNIQLQSRRQACEWINKVHGLNVSVEFNIEVEAMARQMATQNNIDNQEGGPTDE